MVVLLLEAVVPAVLVLPPEADAVPPVLVAALPPIEVEPAPPSHERPPELDAAPPAFAVVPMVDFVSLETPPLEPDAVFCGLALPPEEPASLPAVPFWEAHPAMTPTRDAKRQEPEKTFLQWLPHIWQG